MIAGDVHLDVAAALVHRLHVRLFQPLLALAARKAVAVGRNRSGHQLHADRIAVGGLDVRRAVLMDVAGKHHRVAHARQVLDEPLAGRREPVPLVDAVRDGHNHDAVDHDVPLRRAGLQLVVQPLLLLGAQDAGSLGGLLAVLAGIHQVEADERADVEAVVDAVVRAIGKRGRRDRQVLVERAVGGGALVEEVLGAGAHLRDDAGVVVFHLVVVPHHGHRGAGVRGLQVLIGLEQRVAQAVLLERFHLGLERVGHGRALAPQVVALLDGVLVDVVADEDGQIQLRLLHDVLPRGVVAVVPGLAGGDREGELVHLRARRGQRLETPDGADVAVHLEAVEVLRRRLEAVYLRVYRVGELPLGEGLAALDDVPKVPVRSHLPADGDVAAGHAAVAVIGKRVRGEAGP